MVEREQLARIVVRIIVFIVINGVRGPEARRHVTRRRTETGANVEDGSNNQKMVFQFDLYGYLFPGRLVHQSSRLIEIPRLPPLCSSYVRSDNVRIPHAGHLYKQIIMHQLPHGPRMLPLFLHLLARKQKSLLSPMSRAVSRPLCQKLGMFGQRRRRKSRLHMKSYIYTQIKDHSFQ